MPTSKLLPTLSWRALAPAIIAMALVIFASNRLVQFPVSYTVWGIDLAGVLTWGAFTYPISFLVTDTTNRLFGAVAAGRVVAAGFVVGVALSAFDAPRIAVASGVAFLTAQTLDIVLFDRLRRQVWWKAPSVSSLVSSIVDTGLFFSLASTGSSAPWFHWAVGDFCAKLLMVALLLLPFKWLTRSRPSLSTTA